MAIYRHLFVSSWRDPDNITHCRILSSDKAEGGLSQLHSADEDSVSWMNNYGSTRASYQHAQRIDQIHRDSSSSPVELWRCAIRHGRAVAATQRPPAGNATLIMMMISGND